MVAVSGSRVPTIYGPYQCPFDSSLLRVSTPTQLWCPTCHAAGTEQADMERLPPVPDFEINADQNSLPLWPLWLIPVGGLALVAFGCWQVWR